jgi:hypothetical protein
VVNQFQIAEPNASSAVPHLTALETRGGGAARGCTRNDLTIVARQIRAVIQKSQQLGLYNINCEARLVLGEMELQLNSSSGRAQLISPAAETRSRGLELIARQAEQAITRANVVVAANKPAHEFQR